MLEPPSASLLKTLSSLKLCAPRDLRRCRGYVRRLTRELPAFDSIWIDALVQSRRLTAFQAQQIEAGKAERLSVGPCVLLERLGGTAQAETFLARRRDANDVCVLKLTSIAPEQIKPLSDRLAKLVATSSNISHPAVALPQATQTVEWPISGEWRLVTICRHVRGPHLAELLMRRGRFPISIVIDLGRQLLDALATLDASELVHGDVLLSNVRITPKGQAVLVDASLVPNLRPEFSFHTILSSDRYDGLAPERISTGQPPTPASDLYSLGCLLWHLLAGRPPFTAGDPLAKLAAHQTQAIGDVREWVPDVPNWLAETLRHWTAMHPDQRPSSLRQAAADFGAGTRAGRRRLARFRGEFDRTLPRREKSGSRTRWPMTVAAVLALAAGAFALSDQRVRNYLASLARPRKSLDAAVDGNRQNIATDGLRGSDTEPSPQNGELGRESPMSLQEAADPVTPLPPVNTSGLIALAANGRFAASEVSARGALEIVGDPQHPATIIVAEQSLRLWAEHVRVRHVRLVRAQESEVRRQRSEDGSQKMVPLLAADCQHLEVTGCRFEQEASGPTQPALAADTGGVRQGTAIAWRPHQETRTSDHCEVNLRDTVFAGEGAAVYLHLPPTKLSVENVLKAGAGDVVQLRDNGVSEWQCELRQVTLRQTGPLIRVWPLGERTQLSRLTLAAHGCVLDVARSASGSSAANARPALIAWMSRRLPSNWESALEWQGSGTLTPSEIDVVNLVDPTNGRHAAVDESRLNIEGLVTATFEFAGEALDRPQDSTLRSFDAPIAAHTQLGIRAESLPVGGRKMGR